MEPKARRIAELWSWLPAFRVVAETEHLKTASELLHVSASALSRTVKQLEDALGCTLFDRVGRQLRLNPEGRRLLDAVRDAMRIVDDGVEGITGASMVGAVRVSAAGALGTAVVGPALVGLRAQHPDLSPTLYDRPTAEAHALLLRGQLDVAFHDDALTTAELEVSSVGRSAVHVFCGRGHSLFGAESPAIEDHAFAVVAADPWPVDAPRRIGLTVERADVAMSLCRAGTVLAVFADVVAQRYIETKELEALAQPALPDCTLYVSRRPRLGPASRVDAVIEAVRGRLD